MSTLMNDLRSLVWALCAKRSVPLLVTDMIADYLDHRDLFKITTLSRSLNEQANAKIYRDVTVDLDGNERSITTASLLFRTLLTSETAARAVRSLSLAGDPLRDWRKKMATWQDRSTEATWEYQTIEAPLKGLTPPAIYADLTDFTEGELKLYDKMAASSLASTRPPTSNVSVWELYLHAFRLAPHIQNLSVSSDYFRFSDFRSTLQEMARDLSLQKLRSCSLALDLMQRNRQSVVAVRPWDSALLMPFAVPDMQSATIVASLRPEVVRQLRSGGTCITRLTLKHFLNGESDVSSLLAAIPSLRYFEYHAIADWNWLTSFRENETRHYAVGLEEFYSALHHVGDSLQELHVSQGFVQDHTHEFMNDLWMARWNCPGEDLPFRQRKELSDLKRLQTLTIPFAQLLGLDCVRHVWDWDKTLPSSLRRIVWTDDVQDSFSEYRWEDEHLMPVISGLVEWLSAPQRGNDAAEFGLRLNLEGAEFNEPVRRRLTRMCEERGVRCSIKKSIMDGPRYNRRAVVPLSPGSLDREREEERRPRDAQWRGRGRGRGRGR